MAGTFIGFLGGMGLWWQEEVLQVPQASVSRDLAVMPAPPLPPLIKGGKRGSTGGGEIEA